MRSLSDSYMGSIIDEVLKDVHAKSQKRIYQTDFNAWSHDVLGRRYYQKVADISDEVMHGDKNRTAIKSGNGAGKSQWLADFATYWVTAFDPMDSLVILSAPTLHQIKNVLMKYIMTSYGEVKAQSLANNVPFPFPGWINESLEWKMETMGGNRNILFGKRPSDRDVVSSFQGTRANRTLVALDEGGGIPTDLFTAAEAVATGRDSRIITVGNPDRRGTEFHRIFTVPSLMAEWATHTISCYDLPTVTGEIVYPDDPDKQKAMLRGLTSRDWIEHKERIWKLGGQWDARGLAKVMGEFPGETDNTFFPQEAIDRAHETEIDDPAAPVVLGVDLAAGGEDESVVYVNRGGRVRLFDREVHYSDGGEDRVTLGTWAKEDEVTSARRVHAIAMNVGADEVRVDSAGLGGGIFRMLERLDEFSDKCYSLFAIQGANSSSDRDRWSRKKEENYDTLRRKMVDGLVDFDPADTQLRDELLVVTYGTDTRGAIKMTPKKDLRSQFGGSPDRLDAVIYSLADVSEVFGPKPGDRVEVVQDEVVGVGEFFYSDSGLSAVGW